MKFKYYLLAAALFGLVSSPLLGQSLPKTGVAGTTHDVGGTGCKACHAPHNGSTANGGTANTGLIMLWSRSFPATANTFGVYDSATMGSKATDVGGTGLTTSSDVRMYSLLCLSCHDGVTSTFSTSMQNANRVGSKASFGTGAYESLGLTNDHPVNMSYNPTVDTGLQPVTTVTTSLRLFGTNNTMQCGTCHDSHNNSNTNYLRQANNTTHCTTCHK